MQKYDLSYHILTALTQVTREEWGIHMVGTCQTDQCGAGPLGKAAYTGKDKEISTNSHESLLYQHKTKPLTLSNFYSPVILRGGMRRKKRNPTTKRRERETSVFCRLP
jgi:hypothetical protein